MGYSTTVDKSHVDKQFDRIISTIKETFGDTSERTVKLLKFYTDFEERVKTAPASSKLNYHCAYSGGYQDHILNVLDCSRMMKKLYEKMGGIIDFTDEELVFTALHHDLGKLGTLEDPYYLVQDSEWHRTNRLEVFKANDDAQYLDVNDGTIYLLQLYGIAVTQIEFLALKLTDGLYGNGAEAYLQQYGKGPFPMRNNLHRIMHWADHMAVSIENDPIRQKMTR